MAASEDRGQKTEGRKAGYYLMARRIDESPVAKMPPHVREIWHLFIRKAMWRDGTDLKRGQLLITYKQIQDDLSWMVGYRKHSYPKHACDNATRALAKAAMITTKKTTRGMIVTVLNYGIYQDFESYENDSENDSGNDNETPRVRHDREVKNTKKEVIEEEDARVAFELLKREPRLSSLGEEQFNAILAGLDPRPADLPAAAREVALEAKLNKDDIRNPAVFIRSRLPAVAEKMSEGENPKKNRAPALILLRPAGAVDQRARLLAKAEQLLATEAAS